MEPKPEVNKRRNKRPKLRANTKLDLFALKFPPEIASHIFSLFMNEYDHEDSTLRRLPSPFILGSVCKGWRQLALSTPQLWSTISFTLTKPRKWTRNEAFLQFINDWLQRSRSLPLDLWVYDYRGNGRPLSQAQYLPIIDALNQHSGRWRTLHLSLRTPSFFHLFCGASPPSNLRSLQLIAWRGSDFSTTFRMHSRPSPTHLTIDTFFMLDLDIMWDSLKHLTLRAWTTNFDKCIGIMQQAPQLESYSLSTYSGTVISPLSKPIVRHMYLRKLKLFNCSDCSLRFLTEFLNLMELPSLEEYYYQSQEGDILADSVISLLNRSGSHLKVLHLELGEKASAMEDINKLLNAVPYLQKFQLELRRRGPKTAFIMDDLFLQLSSSPPILEGGTPGLLPNLQSLTLYSGEGYKFDCIPDIFSWPHRKILSLKVDGSRPINLDKDTLRKISKLIDQEFKIRILRDEISYF